MLAHGADPDAVDQETFTDICVMYVDGHIGNRGIIELLGSLTAGVFNALRGSSQRAFTLQDIIPASWAYLEPPLSEEAKAARTSQSLLAFMSCHPMPQAIKDTLYGDAG